MHHAGRGLTYFNAVLPLWFDLATKSMRLWRDARRIGATLRRRDLRNLQDVARAFAHLDRVADAALRAFKNLSRHDVADRVLAPPEANCWLTSSNADNINSIRSASNGASRNR